MYDVIVIGCGIVGAAVAYELAKYELRVALLEAENDVATGATKANSAILHAGYDPLPGTHMARLNIRGAAMAGPLCRLLDVPYRQSGSLVLAFSKADVQHLRVLHDRGMENGVPELRLLSGDETRALEPGVSPAALGALLAPGAAIVSPWEYALALAETAVRRGVELHLNRPVEDIQPHGDGYRVIAGGQSFDVTYIVNAAGIHSDRIHNMAAPPAFVIRPSRGEYYLLDKSEGARVSRVIFHCPGELGKGVLVAPTVHGNLIVGPNHEDVAGENTANTAAGLATVARLAKRSVPGVDLRVSIRNFAGVRAASDADDFIIGMAAPGFLDLAGIKSPGLTAAPAIAELAVEQLRQAGLNLRPNTAPLPPRQIVRFRELSEEARASVVGQRPDYGRIICRCETVTEGEIRDALRGPIPPRSVDGVKRRCGSGMGRCQGGFCAPRIVELLAREGGMDPTEVVQDRAGSQLLPGATKEGEMRGV